MSRKKAGSPGCIIPGRGYHDRGWHVCRPWLSVVAGSMSSERQKREEVTGSKNTRTRLRKKDRKKERRKREQGGRLSHIATAAAPGYRDYKDDGSKAKTSMQREEREGFQSQEGETTSGHISYLVQQPPPWKEGRKKKAHDNQITQRSALVAFSLLLFILPFVDDFFLVLLPIWRISFPDS